MTRSNKTGGVVFAALVLAGLGARFASGQPAAGEAADAGAEPSLGVIHAECALFGPRGHRLRESGLTALPRDRYRASSVTVDFVRQAGGKTTTHRAPAQAEMGTIDSHLFRAMEEAGVAPAAPAGDYEFLRRVTLDLTGRIPTYERVVRFINAPAADRRARYIDELIGSPAWVDKWTMFFDDLLEVVDNNNQVQRYPEGRNALHNWVRQSIAVNKPYDRIARELLTASGDDSFSQGEINWMVGHRVTGGPAQDIWDQMAAKTAEQFLGMSHVNCVLCHDGRRHLDLLSVWGKQATRRDSWQLSAFFSKTAIRSIRTNQDRGPRNYFAVADNPRLPGYALNTTTGNRPERKPIGALSVIAPEYPFGPAGLTPANGENYREALARFLVEDPQFARAMVNRIWKEFFARGIVDPVSQFDPGRMDPANPPPDPWTIQPTNPDLLNALARDFRESGYDLQALMRQIANSGAYQLSARYDGGWKPEYERLFARKLVRRLWAEEIVDAIVQTSNRPQGYNVNGGFGRVDWAMQLPQTTIGGSFLDSFLRGDRVEEERRTDGSIAQALNLMNDGFVQARTRAAGTGDAASLARKLLTKYTAANNRALVVEMFLTVLTRQPEAAEAELAVEALSQGNRQQRVEDLLWSLYNKVDFIYNY
ncbi:MAG: DUF1553 domain-containing protein [Bryobacteraceae bacterium]